MPDITPYIVDVAELLDSPGAVESLDAPFDLHTLIVGSDEFVLLEPATVHATIANAGSGIVASGTVHARVRAECARCLEPFETDITGEIEGFYTIQSGSEDDDAERIAPGLTIDVAPAMVAALVIEAPFVPLHDPNCRGLCPTCGVDLNLEECECASAPDPSHPFAGLGDLFSGNDSE